MRWKVRDPNSGQVMVYEGDVQPTKEELDMLFGKVPQYTQPIGPSVPTQYDQPIGPQPPSVGFAQEGLLGYASRSPAAQRVSNVVSRVAPRAAELGWSGFRAGLGFTTQPVRTAYNAGRVALDTASELAPAAIRTANTGLGFLAHPVIHTAGNIGAMVGRGLGTMYGQYVSPAIQSASNWFARNFIPSAIPAGTVKVISPEGVVGMIPAENLEQAQQIGYRVVE